MIAKHGKPPNKTSSYKPVSLLTIISKVFEKLLLKRKIKQIPKLQFGCMNMNKKFTALYSIKTTLKKKTN